MLRVLCMGLLLIVVTGIAYCVATGAVAEVAVEEVLRMCAIALFAKHTDCRSPSWGANATGAERMETRDRSTTVSS